MVGCHGVDALHGGGDAVPLAQGAHAQRVRVDVALVVLHVAGYLEVREAQPLGLAQHVGGQVFYLIILFQTGGEVHDVLHRAQEPRVDLRQLVDALHGVALFQCLGDGEYAQVRGVGQLLVQVVEGQVVVPHEAVHPLPDHAEPLLDDFLERVPDGHDFAHRLHARADAPRHADELREVPARYLHNHVVHLRGHRGGIGRARLAYLVQRVAQGELRRHEGQG